MGACLWRTNCIYAFILLLFPLLRHTFAPLPEARGALIAMEQSLCGNETFLSPSYLIEKRLSAKDKRDK